MNHYMDSAELELFPERQYSDPLLTTTGKIGFTKRHLQRRLMQAQISRYYGEFAQVLSSDKGAVRESLFQFAF